MDIHSVYNFSRWRRHYLIIFNFEYVIKNDTVFGFDTRLSG